MSLSYSDIWLLYRHEMRSALRERTIIVNSILLPIFLYPLLLWLVYTGITFVVGQTEGFSSRVTLKGITEDHKLLKIGIEREKQIEIKKSNDPVTDIRNGSLDALLDVLPPPSGTPELRGNLKARVTYDNSKDRSRIAKDRLNEQLSRYRDRFFEREAQKLGVTPAQLQQVWLETNNIATGRQMGQFVLGLMIPIFLVIMIAVGSMYPAIDSTAGEREKSTWETLMTAATDRTNIIVAKYLYVSTMACVAGMLNLAAMMFSMKSILAPILGDRITRFSFQIPLLALPLIVIVTILLALFISAGMMILASFARTFKEGQSMVSPFYLAIMLPVMFLQVPGLEFTPLLAALPVVNVCMLFREAIAGVFHWRLIGITLAVETACIALSLLLATTILRYEDFLLGSYGGSFGKFVKQRLIAGRRREGGA